MKKSSTLILITVLLFSCKVKGIEYTAGEKRVDVILDTSIYNIYHPETDTIIYSLQEPCKGGETGCLKSKAYKDAAREWECDTISAAQLDPSNTFTDLQHKIIIYNGQVYFLDDGEKAKEVLKRFEEMRQRANDKIDPK